MRHEQLQSTSTSASSGSLTIGHRSSMLAAAAAEDGAGLELRARRGAARARARRRRAPVQEEGGDLGRRPGALARQNNWPKSAGFAVVNSDFIFGYRIAISLRRLEFQILPL